MSINSSFNSSDDSRSVCLGSRHNLLIFSAFCMTNMFLLPLFILVLYMGYQRWRKQRSSLMAVMMSHSDIFTYNVVALELMAILGTLFYCCGALINVSKIKQVGSDIFTFTSPGQNLFHLLTCVERYLAVVHPITYLGLRQAGGVRIRNISVGCVWLLCFLSLNLSKVFHSFSTFITQCCILVFYISVVTFCSLSVLCILIRPGPREGGADRKSIDQTKRRAFHTITAIMAALWLRFVGVLGSSQTVQSFQNFTLCAMVTSTVWLTMPGSLVLPLLFLHRAGKLSGCKSRTKSGSGY